MSMNIEVSQAPSSETPGNTEWDNMEEGDTIENIQGKTTWDDLAGENIDENTTDTENIDVDESEETETETIEAEEDFKSPMVNYTKGTDEEKAVKNDPDYIAFQTSAENGQAILRSEAVDALETRLEHLNNVHSILEINNLANAILKDGSGFSDEEKARAKALAESPSYRKANLISQIRGGEGFIKKREADLKRCEEELELLLTQNRNIIDKFMNRHKIKQARDRVEWTKRDIENARGSLSRNNRALTELNKSMLAEQRKAESAGVGAAGEVAQDVQAATYDGSADETKEGAAEAVKETSEQASAEKSPFELVEVKDDQGNVISTVEPLEKKFTNNEEDKKSFFENNPDYVTFQMYPGDYRAVKREDVMADIMDRMSDVSEDPGMLEVNHLMNIVQAYKSGFSEEDKQKVAEIKKSKEYKVGMLRAEIRQKSEYLETKKKDLNSCNIEAQRILTVTQNKDEYERALDRIKYVRDDISKASNRLQRLRVELNDALRADQAA